MTPSRSPRVSLWSRLLWSIQVVVFVGAGVFAPLAPVARPLQNATRPVASAPHHGERMVASRERAVERTGRLRTDPRGDAGHEPILVATPPTLPVVGPSDFVIAARWSATSIEPRRLRFSLHAPRGPPPRA